MALLNVPGEPPPGYEQKPDQVAAIRGLIELLEGSGQDVPQWMRDAVKEADRQGAADSGQQTGDMHD
jgi:hypothetical protein